MHLESVQKEASPQNANLIMTLVLMLTAAADAAVATARSRLAQVGAAVVPRMEAVDPTGFVSRRSMLEMARMEHAIGAEVRDVAIGSIFLVVSFVIALVMYPVLTSSIADAQNDPNSTPTQVTLLGLIPTVFIIILVISGVGFLFKGLKQFGGGNGGF